MIRYLIAIPFLLFNLLLVAQMSTTKLSGIQLSKFSNPVITSVPFLMISPDSKQGAMGDLGAATDPEMSATHWNGSKLAFIDKRFGVGFTLTPWLRSLVPNINMIYFSSFVKINSKKALSGSIRYFELGNINLINGQGINSGTFKPNEWSIDLMFSQKISEYFAIGVATRLIQSSICKVYYNGSNANSATAFAIDLSMYFKSKQFKLLNKISNATIGLAITNLGSKINYSNDQNFIPTNMRLGSGLKINLHKSNSLGLYMDFNKLLVPTPPIYETNINAITGKRDILAGKDPDVNALKGVIQSFYDAPGGWREELKEIQISSGLEYWFYNACALRTGFFYEDKTKGQRQYFTFGLGYKYKIVTIDASYLKPIQLRSPLQNTWRISLSFLFGSIKKN